MMHMTVNVNIHEAKTHLSRLLEQVAAGERVVISKAGTPIADLVPHQAATVTFGGLKGEVAYSDQAFDIDPDIQQMLLLDSHTLLWLLDDNPRLGPRARQAITSAQGVYVSAATIWELTIKTMLGKLSIPADFSKRLTAQGLALLSITAEHAEAIRDFPELVRHDPFG